MQNAILLAATVVGSQALLAKALGVHRTTVNSWVHGRNKIPAETAIQIEKITNSAVTRQDLRPDLFT